ncbi:hypothetical protein AB0O68_11510 [Streptomyces sp. NPDC087512]|uniref:hypothetical protein n=1 Tax=Streptomyces sp. NPDC087512 TaxID=3155059 RepID=UPI00343E9131
MVDSPNEPSPDKGEKSVMSMTMQQAADQADAMLDATLDAIKPGVHWAHGATTTGTCDVSRRRVVMTIVSKERMGSFLGLVQRFWEKQGYRIKSVNTDEEFPAIHAQSSDGFGISLTVGSSRQVFFEVATPCARPSDVADSTTPPNGPSYDYPIPRPNAYSDFWSSTASTSSATTGSEN